MKKENIINECNDLFVIDLNGHKITVTDLDKAIEQAKQMKSYWHIDTNFSQANNRLFAYWMDMYDKLTALKTKIIQK